MAVTEQLIAPSHQAVGRVSARIHQTHRRVQRTSQARVLHRLAAEELADYQVWIAAAKDQAGKAPRGSSEPAAGEAGPGVTRHLPR